MKGKNLKKISIRTQLPEAAYREYAINAAGRRLSANASDGVLFDVISAGQPARY
jgi:hypothetical protein